MILSESINIKYLSLIGTIIKGDISICEEYFVHNLLGVLKEKFMIKNVDTE